MSSAPAKTEEKKTVKEILDELQQKYIEKVNKVAETREKLVKLQEELISDQEAAFKAQQIVSTAERNHLINVVNQQSEQLKAYEDKAKAKPAAKAAKPLPAVVEEMRDDNVE